MFQAIFAASTASENPLKVSNMQQISGDHISTPVHGAPAMKPLLHLIYNIFTVLPHFLVS